MWLLSILVLALILAQTITAFAPLAFTTAPSLDCSGTCVAQGAAMSGSTKSVTLSQPLSTSPSDTSPLVIAIVGYSSTDDRVSTPPAVNGASMGSLCTLSAGPSVPFIGIYYYSETSALSSAPITVTITDSKGSSTEATLVAFAIAGASNGVAGSSPPASDVACTTSSSTSGSPSGVISGFKYQDDFVFSAAEALASSISVGSGTTQIANTGSAVSGLVGVASCVGTSASCTSGSSSSSYTFSYTASSTGWSFADMAIKSSSATPVPLFPFGVLPVLLVMTVVYILLRQDWSTRRRRKWTWN